MVFVFSTCTDFQLYTTSIFIMMFKIASYVHVEESNDSIASCTWPSYTNDRATKLLQNFALLARNNESRFSSKFQAHQFGFVACTEIPKLIGKFSNAAKVDSASAQRLPCVCIAASGVPVYGKRGVSIIAFLKLKTHFCCIYFP